MTGQLSFLEIEPPSQTVENLFLAFLPGELARQEIAKLAEEKRREYGLRGKAIPIDRLHQTLMQVGVFQGGYPGDLVSRIAQAVSLLDACVFDIHFDTVMSFRRNGGGKNPFVLTGGDGMAELMAFYRSLCECMSKAGFGRWVKSQFKPHVTLLYDDQMVPAHSVTRITVRAESIVLIRSLVGETIHEELARWKLRD